MAAEDAYHLYSALVEEDPAKAIQVVERVRAAGAGQDELFDALYVPAMALLGGAWASGAIDEVAFARAAVAAEQVAPFVTPSAASPDVGVGVVVGTAAEDRHTVRLAIIAGALKQAGYRVTDAGAGASAADFVQCVRQAGARIVIVFAEMTYAAHAVADVRHALDAEGLEDVVLLVSGGPFVADKDLARALGANGVVSTAETALRVVARVVQDFKLQEEAP